MSARVVKVGGRMTADPVWLRGLAGGLAQAGSPAVVVHGGGPEISEVSERLGIPVVWSAGRRITPPEALGVATMVLSGRANKRIVSALLDAGLDAVGLSGEDGALLVAEPSEGGRLGRVGDVVRVRVDLLRRILDLGLTPVLSPISRGTDGAPLNVNADDAATAVAVALGAAELLFLTDVDFVHDGVTHRSELTAGEAAALIAAGTARDGMAVKLQAALRALEAGVPAARIGPPAVLADPGAGTWLRPAMEVCA